MAAVSLIHRLQRERGATSAVRHGLKPCQSCLGPGCPAHLLPACADHTVCLLATKTCPQWVASGDTLVSPQQDRLKPSRPCACGTGSLVADLRRRTDRLAHEGIEKELKLLRDQADRFSGEPQECARMLFATLTGYSNLIKTLIDSALETGSYLKAIAMHKELYGRQRAFLIGVGGLPSSALAALPPRALVFILNVHEEMLISKARLEKDARLMTPTARERQQAALAIDDWGMAELSDWLRSDEFDLAALHARFAAGEPISTETCWVLWTAHIDKLQTLEDHLLEEHYEAEHKASLRRKALTHFAAVGCVLLVALMIQVGALSALGLDGLVPPPAQLFLVGFLIACAAIGSGMWLIIERQAVKQWEALQLKTKAGKEHAQLGAAGIDSKWSFRSETSSMSPLGTSPSSGSSPHGSPAASMAEALVCNPPQPTVFAPARVPAPAPSPAPSPLCRPVTPHGMVGGSDGAGGGALSARHGHPHNTMPSWTSGDPQRDARHPRNAHVESHVALRQCGPGRRRRRRRRRWRRRRRGVGLRGSSWRRGQRRRDGRGQPSSQRGEEVERA